MGLYTHIPPCPPEGEAVSKDKEGAVGTCPERGGVEMSWSHIHTYHKHVLYACKEVECVPTHNIEYPQNIHFRANRI